MPDVSALRRVMELDEEILNSLHIENNESAFYHAPLDSSNNDVLWFNNLLEAQAYAYASDTSVEDGYYSEDEEICESSPRANEANDPEDNTPVSSDGDETRLEIIGDETDNDYPTEEEWSNIEFDFAGEIDAAELEASNELDEAEVELDEEEEDLNEVERAFP